MRPYLAVLKDSIREAVASRVLLITLIGIIVVLLLLAPFGISTELSTRLRRSEVTNAERLALQLLAGENETATPAAHLWSLLNKQQQNALKQAFEPEEKNQNGMFGRQRMRRLVNNINKLLENPDFYKADHWANVNLSEKTRELLEQPSLSAQQTQRRNLLLLADGFSTSVKIVESQSITLTYGTGTVAGPLPLTPSQFQQVFDQVISSVVTVFLGFFGVFGSLLVTSGIVPRTFEPGEIALLLSKPTRRSGLFVAKFLGGCVFTLFYATVLVVGIWLLLGVRMDIWRYKLLWCIPIYIFLFAIYYSVSALAGAIWRNATVSIVLVIVFWVSLTIVAFTRNQLQTTLVQEDGIKEIIVADDELLAVDGRQSTLLWDDSTQSWKPIFAATTNTVNQFARLFLASETRFLPVYDEAQSRILALEQSRSPFGGLGLSQLVMSTAEDNWERIALGRTPEPMSAVYVQDNGRIVLPAQSAVYEFVGQTEKQRKSSDTINAWTGGLFGTASKAFPKISKSDYPDLGKKMASPFNPTNGHLLLYGNSKLVSLQPEESGSYQVSTTQDIDTQPDKETVGVVAMSNQHGIVALNDGRILVVDLQDLKTLAETQLPEGVLPKSCASSADGTLTVLTHEETLILWNPQNQKLAQQTLAFNRVCSGITFDSDGNLLVANGRRTIHKYGVGEFENATIDSYAEKEIWVHQLYDWAINPLWRILPKPAQLDQLVNFVLSGERSILVNENQGPPGFLNPDSLQAERETFRPTQTLLENALFVIAMLALGCFVVSRRDF